MSIPPFLNNEAPNVNQSGQDMKIRAGLAQYHHFRGNKVYEEKWSSKTKGEKYLVRRNFNTPDGASRVRSFEYITNHIDFEDSLPFPIVLVRPGEKLFNQKKHFFTLTPSLLPPVTCSDWPAWSAGRTANEQQ